MRNEAIIPLNPAKPCFAELQNAVAPATTRERLAAIGGQDFLLPMPPSAKPLG